MNKILYVSLMGFLLVVFLILGYFATYPNVTVFMPMFNNDAFRVAVPVLFTASGLFILALGMLNSGGLLSSGMTAMAWILMLVAAVLFLNTLGKKFVMDAMYGRASAASVGGGILVVGFVVGSLMFAAFNFKPIVYIVNPT